MAIDPDVHNEVAGMFLEDGSRSIALTRIAVDVRNSGDIDLAAHTLKRLRGQMERLFRMLSTVVAAARVASS